MRGVERALKEKRARCIVPQQRKLREKQSTASENEGDTRPRELSLQSLVY